MSTPQDLALVVGVRYCAIYPLGANGLIYPPQAYIDANYITMPLYGGLEVVGITAMQGSEPAERVFNFNGNDGLIGSLSLPSLEPFTGSIQTSANDFGLIASIEGTKVRTMGEAKILGRGTNKRGPRFAIWFYQEGVDLNGAQVWHSVVYPSCRLAVQSAGAGASPEMVTLQITPTKVSKHVWGQTFEDGTGVDGYAKSQKHELLTEGKPVFYRMIPDGSNVTFSFPTDKQALSVEKVHVFHNGSELLDGAGVTITTSGIVMDSPSLDTDDDFILSEVESED